jgi:hypothetical protein
VDGNMEKPLDFGLAGESPAASVRWRRYRPLVTFLLYAHEYPLAKLFLAVQVRASCRGIARALFKVDRRRFVLRFTNPVAFTSTVSPATAGARKENSRTGILPVLLGGGASRQAFPGGSLGTRRKTC